VSLREILHRHGYLLIPRRLLQDSSGNSVLEPLKLHIVTVVERDESDRLIRYENKKEKIEVTHKSKSSS